MARGDDPEPGYPLGFVLIAGLVVPQIAAITGAWNPREPASEPWMGAYLIYVGCLFLASYYWSEKTFVLRGFRWVCEHFSGPASEKMAFFYFALCVFFGVMAMTGAFS